MAIDKVQLQSLDVENTPLGQNVPEDYVFFYDAVTGVPNRVQIKDIQVTATGTVYTVNGATGNVVLDYSDVGALPDTYFPTWNDVADKPNLSLVGHTHVPSDVVGKFSIGQIPTGTTSTTVSLGNHNHNDAYATINHNHLWSDITAGVPETAKRWPTLVEVGITDNDLPRLSLALSTEDLNTITTPGFYHQPSNANTSTARHYPVTQAGSLLVTQSAGISQFYTTYPTSGQSTWQRNYYSGAWSIWVKVYTSEQKPTYSDVGSPSTTGAGATGTWGISVSGNAATATTLKTARTINGVSFNGSANITTATWGTARTITIGNTGKYVDGSANVAWSLAEIGAQPAGSYAAASHTHTPSQVGLVNVPNMVHTSAATASTVAVRDSAGDIACRLLRPNYANESAISGALAYRVNNSTDNYVRFCSNTTAIRTWLGVAAASHTHAYAPLTGAGTSGTWPISVTGNAATATTASSVNAASSTNRGGFKYTFSGGVLNLITT